MQKKEKENVVMNSLHKCKAQIAWASNFTSSSRLGFISAHKL